MDEIHVGFDEDLFMHPLVKKLWAVFTHLRKSCKGILANNSLSHARKVLDIESTAVAIMSENPAAVF